jgi:hypothetical protein
MGFSKDKHKTIVVFRMVKFIGDKEPELLALFPKEKWDSQGHIACYARIGQHGGAHYLHCIRFSRPATPIEYKPLQKELEGFGYNLDIKKRKPK